MSALDGNEDVYNHYKNTYRKEGRDMYWEMKDGSEIMIKNMKDSHVKNSYNMLKRKDKNGTRSAWIEILDKELLYRRGMKINKIKNKIKNNN